MSATVGFVGLGIMGEGMAARLLSEGVAGGDEATPLVVWNRTPSKCTALKETFPDKNIVVKDSPKQVVEACSITYCMLSTPEASRAVFEGDDGVLAAVSEGKSIVDCATLAEEDMKRMHDAVVAKGGYVVPDYYIMPQTALAYLHIQTSTKVASWKLQCRDPRVQRHKGLSFFSVLVRQTCLMK